MIPCKTNIIPVVRLNSTDSGGFILLVPHDKQWLDSAGVSPMDVLEHLDLIRYILGVILAQKRVEHIVDCLCGRTNAERLITRLHLFGKHLVPGSLLDGVPSAAEGCCGGKVAQLPGTIQPDGDLNQGVK